MALFRRKNLDVLASGYSPGPSAAVAASLGSAFALVGASRSSAMRIPAIARARDLLVTLGAGLELRHYLEQWNPATAEVDRVQLPPDGWMKRPDPNRTRQHTIAWTIDDLIFYGFSCWHVTSRYATGFPASFERMPMENLTVMALTTDGNAPVGEYTVRYAGQIVPNRDVVLFTSASEPVLRTGARTVRIAERLDEAAERFANTPAAFGWLRQTEAGEPLSGDELAELAGAWTVARDTNAIAAISSGVEWHESQMDPVRLQLLEARQHQALEAARVVGVNAALLGAPTGSSMTYSSVAMAIQQLVLDAGPLLDAIEQTLSGPTITPRDHVVMFDRERFAALDPANALTEGNTL